ncbi:hypothetical protein TIFTF001_053872 [Ficus carica]|uniref:Uncharacterized protein n=1 Tax=Ficus carica TaxID=3494 RepID=A0AA88EJ98_FICCA|nr:hypothetical protein TIFTF001_053872 [Ficus carica]
MEVEYWKVVRQNDIKDRFVVPKRWMDILRPQFRNGENEASIKALDSHGFFREFRCAIRTGPQEKPSLQALEWQKFIKHAGIQEGDSLILQAEENLTWGTNYKIRVQRMDAHGDWYNVPPPAPVVRGPYPFLN